MSVRSKLVVAVSALLPVLLFTACSPTESGAGSRTGGTASQDGSNAPSEDSPKLLWAGDSIAVQLELPLCAAADASGLSVTSTASDGGGNVVGPDK